MSLDVNISEPEEFNCIELHSCIEEVANRMGFDNVSYHVDLIGGKGENYIANLFRVLIKEVGYEDKNTAVIVKTLINTTRRELFRDIHMREVLVYNEIIPKFQELQNKIDYTLRIYLPDCLYTSSSKNKEVIILKDLREDGYEIGSVISKYEELSFEQAKLILTELAKFHALSFVYEHTEKDNFDETKRKFGDILFQQSFLCKSRLRNYFFESFDMSMKVVTDFTVQRKLGVIRHKLLDILKMYNQPSRTSVLCHGDLWLNNIFLKEGINTNAICFLDYQVMRYCCPVLDIIYFIYLSTTSKFRSEHFEDLLEAYYNSLSSYLKLYDIETYAVYPKQKFDEDIESNLPYGLLIALIELRITTTHSSEYIVSETEEELKKPDIKSSEGFDNDLFTFRVNDVIEESLTNGAFDKLLKTVETKYLN